MDIFSMLSFLGGLALFLFGMSIMGEGLEKKSEDFAEEVSKQLAK